jgi:putative oxidoreductase
MQRLFSYFMTGPGAVGLLFLRVVVGAAFMLHGWDKIQHPFSWMDSPGKPPSTMPDILQALAALSEFGGGLAIIVGFLTPIAAFGIACTMIVAMLMVSFPNHWQFVVGNMPGKPFVPSYELNLVFLAIMVVLMFVGPGIFSLDALFFNKNRKVPDERLKMGRQGAGL